jgi:hypothetical protein
MSTIIVGNGPSLIGGDKGKEIDLFDTVVRINNFRTEGFEQDVGTKTSIWCRSDASDILAHNLDEFERTIIMLPIQNYNRQDRLLRIRDILDHDKTILCPKFISSQTSADIKCSNREWPSTGMLAINYFVMNGYKDISICGFDGGKGGIFKHYYDEQKSRYKGHNFQKESIFISELCRKKILFIL